MATRPPPSPPADLPIEEAVEAGTTAIATEDLPAAAIDALIDGAIGEDAGGPHPSRPVLLRVLAETQRDLLRIVERLRNVIRGGQT